MTHYSTSQISFILNFLKTILQCQMNNIIMREMLYMKCGVLKSNEDMILALAGEFLSNCLMNLKNSGDSTGFEPMTSAMPVQCSNQLSYEVTQLRAGQFVGLMFSRERYVV